MGASLQVSGGGPSGARRRNRRNRKPMAEINVTPFVDVTLVLLIIFMVAAPLMTVGVPVDLPSSRGDALPASDKPPLTLTVRPDGKVYLGSEETEIPIDELQPKLAAITQTRGGQDEPIYVRGDKATSYGDLIRVMGRIAEAGYKKVSFVTELEEKR